MNWMRFRRLVLAAWVLAQTTPGTTGADWPMWRFDAGRTAASPEQLPPVLHLQWTRQYSSRAQVWDDPLNHDLMPYDKVFEPVVAGERMFIGFNDTDKVVALDTRTGAELWTFYTEGPVRLPPAVWQDKAYFSSDDGCLYCVNADDGRLVWKFRGGPSERKVIGNERIISAWPARGGPVVRDGRIYFAASIWPFMGTFIYALDAASGKVAWVNDGTGAQFIRQPHSAPSFGGVAPQGAFVATKDHLLVPGGRSVPAAFDRHTGEILHFNLNDGGKGNGGSFVAANDAEFFVHTRYRGTRAYDLKTGKKSSFTLNEPVLDGDMMYSAEEFSFRKAALPEAEQRLTAARKAEATAKTDAVKAAKGQDAEETTKTAKALAVAKSKTVQAEQVLAAARQAWATGWQGKLIQAVGADHKVKWELEVNGLGDLIKAGSRLYAASSNSVFAVELPQGSATPKVVWTHPVDGEVQRLLAANGRLFAVTLDGRILAFGIEAKAPVTLKPAMAAVETSGGEVLVQARVILKQAQAGEGYALCFGVDDGQLLNALVTESKLRVVAVDPDAAKVEQFRRRFDAAGFYGTRVTVHQGEPLIFKAPPYMASLVVVGKSLVPRLAEANLLRQIYESIRPYGGALWLPLANAEDVTDQVSGGEGRGFGVPAAGGGGGGVFGGPGSGGCGGGRPPPGTPNPNSQSRPVRTAIARLEKARSVAAAGGQMIFREGALPGAADWTHQYGNVANTVKSDDARVKAPLGLLWFGGNSNLDVLPRHGHGPPEQVIGGRMFIEGMNSLSARDVYTGRVLWKREFDDLGTFGVYFNETYTNSPLSTVYNQKHIPGANGRGANFVATMDAVYVAITNSCHVLDVRTGETVRTITVPAKRIGTSPQWAFIGVSGDVLLGGAGFANFSQRFGDGSAKNKTAIEDYSASAGLAAFDRHTGALLWQTEARHSYLHNCIVVGNGRVYCLDKLPKSAEDLLKRRGDPEPAGYRLVALDLKTGKLLWEATSDIFGTWLGYSEERDLLLQAGANAKDRLKDEAAQGMITYRGKDGTILWRNLDLKYTGPCILHHDVIFTTANSYQTSSGAFNLLDGSPHLVTNPLTGAKEPWRLSRAYGCNTVIASENLLTFRSGAAGYYDLETQSGTGNLGGFKSGCTSNLIIADGVLNAPDYTRTCSCAYQNQTSLALIHMPEMEMWTYSQFGLDATAGERIKRVGINFGAPGDRRADDGTLWLEYPSVGGDSPGLPIEVTGGTNYFRHHAAQMRGEGLAWVAASGIRDVETITITPEILPPPKTVTSGGSSRDDDDDDEASAAGKTGAKKKGKAKSAKGANAAGGRKAAPKRTHPPANYTVRLHFAEPDDLQPGQRVFGVSLQGKVVLDNFDIVKAAGGVNRAIVREFKGVTIKDSLAVALSKSSGAQAGPVLSGIELIAEESAKE